jgi:hypothetical protein
MKSFFNTIYEVLESMSRAKAAAHLARMGHIDMAKELMLSK